MGRHPVAVVILHITYARTMKVDCYRFRWVGLHGKHVAATRKRKREPSQHLLYDPEKPRKTCVEMAGRRTFRLLTSSHSIGMLPHLLSAQECQQYKQECQQYKQECQ